MPTQKTAVHEDAGRLHARERTRGMSLRWGLIALAVGVLVPAVILAALSAAYVYSEEQKVYQQSLRETVRALALVVDKEIARREELLRALAASPYLDRGDLAAFHENARRLAPRWDSTIVLADAEGQQLLNTRRPFPAEGKLPRNITFPELRQRYGAEATIVSDLYLAPIGKQYSFAVEVPVMRNGKVRYYVAMGTFASELQVIFGEQKMPATWTVAVLDGAGKIVARNIDPALHVGQMARADLIAQSRAQSEGQFETETRDGKPVIAVFAKSASSGWTTAIGVPKQELLASAARATLFVAIGALLLLILGIVLALYFGRRISGPIHGLVRDAKRLGDGEPVAARASGLRELDSVNAALAQASASLREANAEMARRVKAALEDAERSQRELLQVQKLDALGRLTGGIVHDFNNVLQTISTGLQLAAGSSREPDAKFAIESCRRALEQATRLTRQLAAFARGVSSPRSTLDLRNRLLAMTDLLKGALRSDSDLRFALADDLGLVEIDPMQLELALLNLAINARDAMPGGGRVEIKAYNRRLAEREVSDLPQGEYVCLVVEDTGKGMNAEVLEHAIDPFFTTKEVGKGSGLGLPQVYAFAKQAGGTLALQSEPERGTRATIFLPRARAPRHPAAQETLPASQSDLRLLLVEDEEMVREIAVPALRGQGFRVTDARTAEEALALLDSGHQVDAIFTDIVMPGKYSGIDLADIVRQRYDGIPILLATGYSEQLPAAGARYPVVAKPYDIVEVAARLRRLVASP